MRVPFHASLFNRLIVIFLATIAAYVLVAAAVLSHLLDEHPRTQFSRRLLTSLVERLGEPPQPAAMARLAEDLDVSLTVVGPGLLWRSDDRLPPPDRLMAAAVEVRDFALIRLDGLNVAVLRHHGRAWFVTGFMAPLSLTARLLLGGGAAALLLVAFANYRAVRWLFGPIRDVHRAAERLAAGDLDHRIAVTRSDEIGRLTASVNAMAERIQAMLEARRQLLLAISHEIRSPLTRARVAVEMAPAGKPRERIIAALDDVNRLVGALLEAESLDPGLRMEPVDLVAVAAEAVHEAGDARIDLRVPDFPVTVEGDRLRLLLLVRNLLSNALRHGGAGPIGVTVEPGGLSVTDHGEGIAAADLARLGEPFYRPDASRRRATGGHGLGLYLCRQIARAHGGTLTIDSTPGQGTIVRLVLPAGAPVPALTAGDL